MTDLPPISPHEAEAELAACAPLPDLPPEVEVNGRTFLPALAYARDGSGELEQVKRRGSRGTVVYKVTLSGRNPHDPRTFALKVVQKSHAAALGWREVFFLDAQLNHERIVRFEDMDETPDALHIVTEWCEGALPLLEFCGTLALDGAERLNLFVQACDAVVYLHGRGIIHRDLHLNNILGVVRSEGGVPKRSVKVIDFNNAADLNPTATAKAAVDPSVRDRKPVANASPNQGKAPPSPADDQHILGTALCELLTGSPPAEGRRPLGLHPDLWAVIRRATTANQTAKYPSVAAFRDDLIRFQNGRALAGVPQGPLTRVRKYVRRNPWPVLAAAVFAAVAVVAGIKWWDADRERETANRERDRANQRVVRHRESILSFGKSDWLKRVTAANTNPRHVQAIRDFIKLLTDAYDGRELTDGPDDEGYQLWRARGHYALAEAYEYVGSFPEAATACDTAVRIHRTVLDRNPAAWEHRFALSAALRRYGAILRDSENLDAAEVVTRQAVVEAEVLTAAGHGDPFKMRRLHALTLNSHALILTDLSIRGDRSPPIRDAAERMYRDAITRWEACESSTDATIEDRLQSARVRGLLGQHFLKWGRADAGITEFAAAEGAIARVPAAKEKDKERRDEARARILQGLGQARVAKGQLPDGRIALNEARVLRVRFQAAEPGAPAVCADLAATHLELARLELAAGDRAKARAELDVGLRLLEPFKSSTLKALNQTLSGLTALRDVLQK